MRKSIGRPDVFVPEYETKSWNGGFWSPLAAACPVDSTARFTPPRGNVFVPNFARIACATASGTIVPSGSVSVALMTPHFGSAIDVIWQRSIAFA